ncbi:hypothetical protein EMCG_06093 [[Emmonsia] crescens]|uniref:Uncharacterized protein n=1 Tax=[Emmonsia] crescens TaxID=73230 RepID=A0A0G2J762_9EURO|nr:hypothetical protein EMCG_06093 [Emmonsia crescens UAMH 3008]
MFFLVKVSEQVENDENNFKIASVLLQSQIYKSRRIDELKSSFSSTEVTYIILTRSRQSIYSFLDVAIVLKFQVYLQCY